MAFCLSSEVTTSVFQTHCQFFRQTRRVQSCFKRSMATVFHIIHGSPGQKLTHSTLEDLPSYLLSLVCCRNKWPKRWAPRSQQQRPRGKPGLRVGLTVCVSVLMKMGVKGWLSSPNVPPFPELKASLEQTHLFCKRLWDFPLVKGYENCALCPFWVPEIQLSSLQLIRDPHLWVLLWSVSQNLVSGPQHGILARLWGNCCIMGFAHGLTWYLCVPLRATLMYTIPVCVTDIHSTCVCAPLTYTVPVCIPLTYKVPVFTTDVHSTRVYHWHTKYLCVPLMCHWWTQYLCVYHWRNIVLCALHTALRAAL